MPGIYVMAVLTLVLTAILGITTLGPSARSDRRYAGLILAGLPLSLIVNRFIKTPLVASLAAWTGISLKIGQEVPFWFMVLIWLNAPLFEEAIKLLPIVFPASRTFLENRSRALWAGFGLGIGFGLGEAAYLAHGIAQSPIYNDLPWHVFTGFASERLIVTFGHAFLTSIAVLGFHDGRQRALGGYLTAVGLHALINLGPILLALKLISATVATVGSYISILVAFVVFQSNLRRAKIISGIAQEEIIYFET
jgi:uncharacterized membrane protein YhfC